MIYEDNVTKKCDLENNDSLSIYNNWAAQQNYKAFEIFYNFKLILYINIILKFI
jgi:hypothetical protein